MVLEQAARARPREANGGYDSGHGATTIDLVGGELAAGLTEPAADGDGVLPASRDDLLARDGARLALFTAKVVASVCAVAIAYGRVRAATGPGIGLRDILSHLAPVMAVALFDALDTRGASNPAADIVAAARASLVAAVTTMVVVPLTIGGSGLVVGVVLAALLAPARVVLCAIARAAARRLCAPLRIVLLCGEPDERQLRRDLARQRWSPPTELLSWREVFPSDMPQFKRSWLTSAGKIWDPTDLLVVISDDMLAREENLEVMSRLEDLGARVCSLDSFYERHLGRTRVRTGESLLLLLQLQEDRSAYGTVKSVLEVVVAMAGMVVLAVLGPCIALAIKLTSKGPVLYRQERVGLNGRRFVLIKFRSMTLEAERDGARFATAGDHRVTRVGRFLRRARLDELPQMWNVLRREMSLVGPRPERPEFVSQLSAMFPAYGKRLLVRPGITGWAQVNDAYASCELDDHRRKLERDLYYVRHRSPTLDLQCVARTLASIVHLRGQ